MGALSRTFYVQTWLPVIWPTTVACGQSWSPRNLKTECNPLLLKFSLKLRYGNQCLVELFFIVINERWFLHAFEKCKYYSRSTRELHPVPILPFSVVGCRDFDAVTISSCRISRFPSEE